MSWSENGRKNRMTRVMELLKLNRQGLSLQVIARETGKLCIKTSGSLAFASHFLVHGPVFSKRSLSSV